MASFLSGGEQKNTSVDFEPCYIRTESTRNVWTMTLDIGRPSDLPEFRKPPLTETVLSLQFEPIAGMTGAHAGLLWERFRGVFPFIQEHAPLPLIVEEFERPSHAVEITLEEGRPVPRSWFLNDSGSELIQFQADRFIHNWRKSKDLVMYPRYEPIRERFRFEVGVLEDFLKAERLGSLAVNQCEITYVNYIEPAGVWERHGEAMKALVMCAPLRRGSFLSEPEDVAVRMRFVIPDPEGKPSGRLHASVQPSWKKSDHSPILALHLTARGAPFGAGINGAFEFFDLGREWIVKGFADLTTPEMHKAWERIDG
ncbi:MAG: TIGR04255 family protein [Acidobacteria bacterium]|nr:TIGR04255 family protein [Acidobacteriota bacterium]